MKNTILETVITILIIATVVAVIVLSVAAPCGFYKFAAYKDIPARCLGEYSR